MPTRVAFPRLLVLLLLLPLLLMLLLLLFLLLMLLLRVLQLLQAGEAAAQGQVGGSTAQVLADCHPRGAGRGSTAPTPASPGTSRTPPTACSGLLAAAERPGAPHRKVLEVQGVARKAGAGQAGVLVRLHVQFAAGDE